MNWLKAIPQIGHWLHGLTYLIMMGGAAWLALSFGRSQMAEEVYQQRLAALATDYEQLANDYNRAIRRSAITVLDVSADAVSVEVVRADGQRETFATACDPSLEVYVDYVLLDNRLFIRRVFDANTAPSQATVIEPSIADLDWAGLSDANYGKAVYRRLEPGRWVITVSGNGALGLARAEGSVPELVAQPMISNFEAEEKAMREDIAAISWQEVVGYFSEKL